MNIHSPERQVDETMAQYRERRAQSRAIVRRAVRGPSQAPAVSRFDTARFWLGQHTNPARNAERQARRAAR